MKRFALLGEKLGHSLSPILHKSIYRQLEIDDASYRTVELPQERLKGFFSGFRVGGFDGVNITVPHKAAVLDLLDEVDNKARVLNAVNCVNRQANKLVGYNTDVLGFDYSLRLNNVDVEGKKFAILGAGGSAQAVGAALAEKEAGTIVIVNRTAEKAEELKSTILQLNRNADVIIGDESALMDIKPDCIVNTTSIGMSPNVDGNPLSSAEPFNSNVVAFDLVYNPLQTQFLAMAEQAGATTINGIQMLVAQAVYSVEIWMGGNVLAHVDMASLSRELTKSFK